MLHSDTGWSIFYNYVSQNYWDNPPVQEEPAKPSEPVLPEGWQDVVGTISQTAIEWKLSDQNPLDWCNLDGSRMNGWLTPGEYADWLGTPDPAVYEGFSLTMDSADNSYKVVVPDGTEVEGTYTLDEKGVYTFDNGIPSFTVVGWASFATTVENNDINAVPLSSIDTPALNHKYNTIVISPFSV